MTLGVSGAHHLENFLTGWRAPGFAAFLVACPGGNIGVEFQARQRLIVQSDFN